MKRWQDRVIFLFGFLLVAGFRPACAQNTSLRNDFSHGLTKRKIGDPLENLPSNISVLTLFGERPDISPDNNRVAFMSKQFGDAMLIDIKTKGITCLTCNIPAAAFVRVMHLSTGDYLLIGPDHFENPATSKYGMDLWYLNKASGSKPVKIGQRVDEGLAISKTSLKICYTDHAGPGESPVVSRLVMAELDLSGASPRLINRRTVIESYESQCNIEAQDFYDNDLKMTFFCYVLNGSFDVKGIDLVTQKITNFSNAPNNFNEPEGIFPDGKYTTVEMDRQCEWLGGKQAGNLDLWKLQLDGTGKNIERLTYFNDFEGGKAANPVVATNGTFMAFQAARSADPPGVGHGLLLYWFTAKN